MAAEAPPEPTRRHEVRVGHVLLAMVPLGIACVLVFTVGRELVHHGLPRAAEGWLAILTWVLFAGGWAVVGLLGAPSAIELRDNRVRITRAFFIHHTVRRSEIRFRRGREGHVRGELKGRGWLARRLGGFTIRVDCLRRPADFLRDVGL